MNIQLSHLILVLQTYPKEHIVNVYNTDEIDQNTVLEVSFNKDEVPYKDLVDKLKLLSIK